MRCLDFRAMSLATLVAGALCAAACTCGTVVSGGDSGNPDSGRSDAGGNVDAGLDGGGGADAGPVDAGGCGVCPGCCAGDTCMSGDDLSACGVGGAACVACDPTLADGCQAGACTCGGGFQCSAGQQCSGGACVCNTSACTGCCNAFTNQCDPGNTDTSCGSGGGPCRTCGTGQVCDGGSCLGTGCSRANCPTGCCGAGGCVSPPTAAECGIDSSNCFDCTTLLGSHGVPVANTCSAGGSCSCGGGAVCGEGQECLATGCACTARSCPFGCCDITGTCIESTQQDFERCGIGGAACHLCANVAACNEGVCGICRLDSCDGGCCAGSGCAVSDFLHCGLPGHSCVACDPFVSDRCSANGTCDCGLGAACAAGLQCLGGQCTCTSESCPGCCEAGPGGPVSCVGGTTTSQCGRYGAQCQVCDATSQMCIDGTCVAF
jgi:hypothetical protein